MKSFSISKGVPLSAAIMCATVLICAGALSAYADDNANWHQDAISAQDQANYAQGDFARKFGIQFKPHANVCGNPGRGEASCNARVITDARGAPQAATVPSGLAPASLLRAYNLGTGAASGHQVIAIVDAYDDPNASADLNTYSATFHIPTMTACANVGALSNSTCFFKVNQNGTASLYPAVDTGWALEMSLDIEAAHATCQNCSIALVEANSSSYADLMAAVDRSVALGAKEVSMSWGSGEFLGETSYDSHFVSGVAFTVAAGDNGYGASYPAASPKVIAVGGTSLFFDKNGNYGQEIAWNGTGSGCSVYESVKPAGQTSTACAKRTIADVSAVADPNTGAAVYDSTRYGGRSGWFQVGGTSLATPIIAAVYALSGNTGSLSTVANTIPYANASTASSYATNFHDITSGKNGSCGGSLLCTAIAGYDGPTGLGSPKGAGGF
jgi:subtilase family serine protease